MKLSLRLLVLISLLSVSSTGAIGQATQPPTTPQTPKTTTEPRINIDETFELSIGERRITEENFEASTAVSTDGDAGLNLQIGVGLAAGRIDVLLRNVRGHVRFRGTLDRILDIISNRPAISTKPPPR